jgi:hypothetical protein
MALTETDLQTIHTHTGSDIRYAGGIPLSGAGSL